MDLPKRKSPRLRGHDYSGHKSYFVTICTHKMARVFGDAAILNEWGEIAENELLNIPERFHGVQIDKHVIMPNHIHAIITIGRNAERSRPFPTLSTIIGLYKSGVSKRIHDIAPDETTIWQKSFYDRIIRDEHGYRQVWRYIDENPSNWHEDEYY